MKIVWNLAITNLALGMGSHKIRNKDLISMLDELGVQGAARAIKLLGIDIRHKIKRGENHEKMLTELVAKLDYKSTIAHPIILVACTQSDTVTVPSLARRVATNLNITGSGHIFQLQAGCTGFVESLSLVNSQLSSFGLSQGLILNADIFSNLITTENWMSTIAYSDGASAVAVKTQRQQFAFYDAFHFDNSGCISLDISDFAYTSDGTKTFEFTAREVKKVLEQLKAESDSHNICISHVFFNQTNRQVVSFVKSLINKFFPTTRVPTNVEARGNLNSASIPALIYDNRLNGKNMDPSNYSVFLTFGAGLGVTYLAVPNTTFNQINYCT